MSPSTVIIDTNVLIAANGRNTHASPTCRLRAIERLEQVRESEVVLLDSLDHIFSEYGSPYCNWNGLPGPGDAFFRYLHENKHNILAGRVLQVLITPNPEYHSKRKSLFGIPGSSGFFRF